MKFINQTVLFLVFVLPANLLGQYLDNFKPDFSSPPVIPGMTLVWNDEFNIEGKPDPLSWKYEYGFVRNKELQWYQKDNANCSGGALVIEGRKEKVINRGYVPGSSGDPSKSQFPVKYEVDWVRVYQKQ
jgi:hypothetical protein